MTDEQKPPICYVLHREHHGGWWGEPDRWRVSPMVSETAKTWLRPGGRSGTRRVAKNLIISRFETAEQAEAARLRACETHQDVTARQDAVRAEMAEAMRPYQDRIKQLSAELADRLGEAVKS